MEGKTIAAISTPIAPGGIGVIRISGETAVSIADSIFKSSGKKKVANMSGYTAAYGHAHDKDGVIDECVALFFKGPRSYTGEDVVELSCHGGLAVMKRVLEAAITNGAVLAGPGEFTRRAFINGKMDLTKAEAVMDVINAKTKQASIAAYAQKEGALYHKISVIKDSLMEISAHLTAWIDFPDEGVPELETSEIQKKLDHIMMETEKLLLSYEKGKILREGIDAVLAGKPNTGKSTIMNLLSGYEKSIVTEIPGTTRDVVQETVSFAGFAFNLSDTAGIRESQDVVETIGVDMARRKIRSAQLVFAVFDGSRQLDTEDYQVIEDTEKVNTIAVINKCDLPIKIEVDYLKKKYRHIVYISASKSIGIEKLEKEIQTVLNLDNIQYGNAILANERQYGCVFTVKTTVCEAINAVETGITLDAVSVLIEQALQAIGELTGEQVTDEIIDRVFENFCIGK